MGGSVGTLDKQKKRKDSREKGGRARAVCPSGSHAAAAARWNKREKKKGFPKSSSVPLPPREVCVDMAVNESRV